MKLEIEKNSFKPMPQKSTNGEYLQSGYFKQYVPPSVCDLTPQEEKDPFPITGYEETALPIENPYKEAFSFGTFGGLIAGLTAHFLKGANITPIAILAAYLVVLSLTRYKLVASIIFVAVALAVFLYLPNATAYFK